MIKFTIPGQPVGKARPRVCKTHTYTPQKTKDYETLVQTLCPKGIFFPTQALRIEVYAFYKIPKKTTQHDLAEMFFGGIRPVKKPDVDNVLKIICDALNGIVYKDDAQIVEALIKKYYSDTPRVEVEISEVNE